MVIITDANGNIQAPTIPDNVYQGSNLANEIVFLAPLPQTNVATITFRLPNGILIEEQTMTPYTSVPSDSNLSGWRYVLNDVITQYYGQVSFQIHIYGGTNPSEVWIIKDVPSISAGYYTGLNFKSAGQTFNSWTFVVGTPNAINYGGETAYRSNTGWVDIRYKRVEFLSGLEENQNLKSWLLVNAEKQQPTLITTVAGTFPVLRGVPRLPHSTPSQESWNQILNWVAEANSRMADYDSGNILSKAILPYDSNFIYPAGVSVFDKTTKAIYTSLSDNNSEHELSNTEYWGKTQIYEISPQDMASKTTAGLVYMWEDADGVHIWNTDPQQVNYTEEENEQGGLSVVIKTLNYQIEENQQGGLSVIIGGENE